MTGPSFGGFYEAANGRPPFPWQEVLAARVLEGEWPPIDIPTGCGKSSVIDVAVYALAAGADLPHGQRSPLRIFFVVDRKLVVDDVYIHACKLAAAMEKEDCPAPLQWARERLLLFRGTRPLDVAVMRGGMYRSNTWADAPNQPLVCVSTVDHVGSRLLFRGYGVSPSSRPVHAALIGNDSLLIVDEAHLSRPFLETVEAVRRYQGVGWREESVAPGLLLVEMSATRRQSGGDSQRLTEADYGPKALGPRLERPKLAQMKEVSKLTETAAEEAVRLAKEGVVGVVLNTVAGARTAFETLSAAGHECLLLTGRIRPFDRDALLEKFLPRIRTGATREAGGRLFVVATQTVEVGADLDFDALVTEAAPIDSLRQRFGRLNRIGRLNSASAVILKPKRSRDKDAIYGDTVDETWKWLKAHASADTIDFGVRAMGDLFAASGRAGLIVEPAPAPLMFPAHLDTWAQTNPEPVVDPDVGPFLHGLKEETADVQIVWRADLEDDTDAMRWVPLLGAAPPTSTEALPVPFFAAKRWLEGRASTITDIEGAGEVDGPEGGPAPRVFLIWRGPDESATDILKLRPGDTIVVRSTEGGCDEFGWNPGSASPVRDIGDQCANQRVKNGGGKYRIRVHRDVHPDVREEIEKAIALVQAEEQIPEEIRETLQNAAGARAWGRPQAYGRTGLLVESGWKRPVEKQRPAPVEADEPEDGDASSFSTEVTLRKHTAGVVGKARLFTKACGLNGAAPAVVEAAQRHDIGKQDERFQFMLSPTPTPEPLAKSKLKDRRRRQQSGFPEGARHEFASVLLAEQYGEWPEGCDPELALYLIGSHHGHGRPFPPIWNDEGYTIRAEIEGRQLAVENVHRVGHLDSSWADRYAAMSRKYGWWGLAYLETMLRRADCVRSREEEQEVAE